MARSDAILQRLLELHPKIIDLSLDRMLKIMEQLGHPEKRLPPVIHVAGTNGKGSTAAYLKSMLESAGLRVHSYTSPHLVKFHERISLYGQPIDEGVLVALLEECEQANGAAPITFFEITTAAAFLAFSRNRADYLILEVGLGGRLDATNIVEDRALAVITTIDYDHQQYLGESLREIAHEKAGILRSLGRAVIGEQSDEALAEIERVALRLNTQLHIAGQHWNSAEQHGRLVFEDEAGLLDLPPPGLLGTHQFSNAGNAIAAIRALGDPRVTEAHIASGLRRVQWPARMQALSGGAFEHLLKPGSELWLDGGHNPSAARVVAQALSELNRKNSKPLVLIWGMLNTKDATSFLSAFAPLHPHVLALTIPGESNAVPDEQLKQWAQAQGLKADCVGGIEQALQRAGDLYNAARIIILGSLYLAGHVLALHGGEEPSAITGAARR